MTNVNSTAVIYNPRISEKSIFEDRCISPGAVQHRHVTPCLWPRSCDPVLWPGACDPGPVTPGNVTPGMWPRACDPGPVTRGLWPGPVTRGLWPGPVTLGLMAYTITHICWDKRGVAWGGGVPNSLFNKKIDSFIIQYVEYYLTSRNASFFTLVRWSISHNR